MMKILLKGISRLEAVHVGGNWDNSGNAGPFATNGNNSALTANSNVASFGVSSRFGLQWPRWITRLTILSQSERNTQRKKVPTSRKSERRNLFEKIR